MDIFYDDVIIKDENNLNSQIVIAKTISELKKNVDVKYLLKD